MSYLLTDDDTMPMEASKAAVMEFIENNDHDGDLFDVASSVMKILVDRGWKPPSVQDPLTEVEALARVMDPEAFTMALSSAGVLQKRATDHAENAVAAGWHSPASVAALEKVAERRQEQGRRLIKQRNDARNALRELANKAADALVAAHIRRLDADEPGFSGPNNFYAGVSRARLEAMRVLGVSSLGKKHEIARQVLDHLDQSDV
jgi:hypothetical protein